jgi:hypothetical protein
MTPQEKEKFKDNVFLINSDLEQNIITSKEAYDRMKELFKD